MNDLFQILYAFPKGTEVTFKALDMSIQLTAVYNQRKVDLRVSNCMFDLCRANIVQEIIRMIQHQLQVRDYEFPTVKVWALPVVYQGWELGYKTIQQTELFVMEGSDTLIFESNTAGIYLRHESVSRKQAECRMHERKIHETYCALYPNDPTGEQARRTYCGDCKDCLSVGPGRRLEAGEEPHSPGSRRYVGVRGRHVPHCVGSRYQPRTRSTPPRFVLPRVNPLLQLLQSEVWFAVDICMVFHTICWSKHGLKRVYTC